MVRLESIETLLIKEVELVLDPVEPDHEALVYQCLQCVHKHKGVFVVAKLRSPVVVMELFVLVSVSEHTSGTE